MSKLSQKVNKKEKAVLILLTLAFLIVLPILTFASKTTKIFVNDGASGKEDGSSSHPYSSIHEALSHANNHTKVFIEKGTYEENIEIPEGVEVEGSDKNDVIIKAEDKNLTTVKMHDNTKLMKVTVKGGREGIKIKEGDKALIFRCIVKGSRGNGIFIEQGNTKKDQEVDIEKSEIKFNGRDGIFSEGRKIVVQDSIIRNNESDGIDLNSGSRAWIEGNQIKDNGASGLVIEMRDSQFFSKKNIYSGNKREGAEVDLAFKGGLVKFNKDKFKNNGNYAISRVQRSNLQDSTWNGLIIANDNQYIGNGKGSVSPIFRIF